MYENRLPRPAMIAITVLRVVIGWHFLYEGVAKLTSTTWSAAGYMKASRGPVAEFFRWIASQPQLLDNANLITMYGLTIVGVLLMLGLFTRLAAAGGIAFIVLFYLCNPFIGYFYAIPTEGTYLIRQQEPRGALCPGGDSPDRDRPFCGPRRHPARPLRPAATAAARHSLTVLEKRAGPTASFSRGPEFFPSPRAGPS